MIPMQWLRESPHPPLRRRTWACPCGANGWQDFLEACIFPATEGLLHHVLVWAKESRRGQCIFRHTLSAVLFRGKHVRLGRMRETETGIHMDTKGSCFLDEKQRLQIPQVGGHSRSINARAILHNKETENSGNVTLHAMSFLELTLLITMHSLASYT